MILYMRNCYEVNTDPQRRCYNGCHFSSELRRGAWESLGPVPLDKQEETLQWWRDLNDYAVSARGPSAKVEYRLVKEGEQP